MTRHRVEEGPLMGVSEDIYLIVFAVVAKVEGGLPMGLNENILI